MREHYIETQITNALIHLLKEKDLKNLTITEVCLEAEIGRASFYRYYNSLEEVLNKKSLQLIIDWGEKLEHNPEATAQRVFESLFEHFQEHKEFYSILYHYQLTQVILTTIKEKLELHPNLPNATAYGKSFFSYAIFGWINEWILRGMQEDPDQLNQLFKLQSNLILEIIQQIYTLDSQ